MISTNAEIANDARELEAFASADLPEERRALLRRASEATLKLRLLEAVGQRAHHFLASLDGREMTERDLIAIGAIREALRSALDLPLDEVRNIIEAGAR